MVVKTISKTMTTMAKGFKGAYGMPFTSRAEHSSAVTAQAAIAEHVVHNLTVPYGSGHFLPNTDVMSSEQSQSQPMTSTTGHSRRGKGKKQMSSTSRSYSKRRNFYYTKRRKKQYRY